MRILGVAVEGLPHTLWRQLNKKNRPQCPESPSPPASVSLVMLMYFSEVLSAIMRSRTRGVSTLRRHARARKNTNHKPTAPGSARTEVLEVWGF